jgi:hypothetical protein
MVIRDGKVALQHHNSNPATIQLEGTDKAYSFSPKNNVSLGWVDEEYLPRVLNIKTKACDCDGGRMKPKFFVASDINVSIHETGHLP